MAMPQVRIGGRAVTAESLPAPLRSPTFAHVNRDLRKLKTQIMKETHTIRRARLIHCYVELLQTLTEKEVIP
jgi:hypothetical protein